MTEEEIKALQEKADKVEADLKAEQEGREADKQAHEKTIAEKDLLIKQKTEDVVGARKKFKKLEDLTEEERDAMTEKEIELQERQEALDARQAKSEEAQKETLQKEINARKAQAIKKFAGNNEELAAKIEANFGRISDASKAQTAEEIGLIAQDAYNMLGIPSSGNPVEGAMGDGGFGDAGGEGADKTDFSDTEKGKNLAGHLGLNQAKEETK